eukprot:6197002-Pleurochrysis_carterae.AAC.2
MAAKPRSVSFALVFSAYMLSPQALKSEAATTKSEEQTLARAGSEPRNFVKADRQFRHGACYETDERPVAT